MRDVVGLLLMIALLAGCESSRRPSGTDQLIQAHDPRRDTAKAQQENARAVQLLRQEKYDEAATALKNALAADMMFGPAHNNLGKIHYQQGRYYQAAWEFEYASKLMPNQPEPRNNLGLVFEATGKLEQAIAEYDQARKMEPDNPQIIGNAARARIRRGDRDEQVRALLSELVLKDSRPDWVEWARFKLQFMKPLPQ